MAGFEFRETMSGSIRLDTSPERERAISFTVGGRVEAMTRFLRDRKAVIQGAIEIEGLASHNAARGTMLMDPILGKQVGYELEFKDDQGRPLRLTGRKSVDFLRLMETMTTLPADVLDQEGGRVGQAVLRFDV